MTDASASPTPLFVLLAPPGVATVAPELDYVPLEPMKKKEDVTLSHSSVQPVLSGEKGGARLHLTSARLALISGGVTAYPTSLALMVGSGTQLFLNVSAPKAHSGTVKCV